MHKMPLKGETAATAAAAAGVRSLIRGLENRQENHGAADTSPQDER